jgi:hypothetical protein
MKTLSVGGGFLSAAAVAERESPTHCSAAGHKARPANASLRRPLASGLWLLLFGLQSSILNLPAEAPAATPQDLGRNLTYLRLRRLPDDAAALAAAWKAPALIVDLRHAAGDPAQAPPTDLPLRPRTAPLIVLTGPDTAPALFAMIRGHAAALISIGLAAPGLTPDIVLSVSPEADRRAYDALEASASVESLISEKIAKPRFDEAALAHEHTADATAGERAGPAVEGPNAAPPAANPPPAAPIAVASPAAPEVTPKDAVLQRAVQLHRALLALGKLPPG